MRTILLMMVLAGPAFGQGCSQCSQTVGQTPPKTQAAYRRAIVVMVFGGSAVFAAGVMALRRFR